MTPIPSRSVTPKPPDADNGESNFRSGMLTIRIFSGMSDLTEARDCPLITETRVGRGLALPSGVQVPDIIQKALNNTPLPRKSTEQRESIQRKRFWWLPYVVLEFDKNEILIDALGGDLSKPEWNYRADL